ncbi:serine/threonine-protein kinase [Enterovirga aerilata]|uniref:Serine/threonine protein kinase n=1 Tax=Enterovirga aerilata TaxID=2730920 RepID=A0A849ICM5_9HYPH|nr:serine/threonine-protein kinase [Enterovirga sp. DB1703]NNM75021.1 serine/threonine protein kinase [Enterovirga sp. DB1703]
MSQFVSHLTLGPEIGSGHFGRVLMGQDPVHDVVAVKLLEQKPGEPDADWALRKAGLLAEGQHLRQATHANVVQVHHAVERVPDAYMIVMEYCEGGSLQAAFESGPSSLSFVRKVGTEITAGLQALHNRQMLHRDIKPANILLKQGTAKIGDFGLVTDNIVLGYASQAGYNDHLPPEVHQGGGTSVKSDIWALGMTLYRLLHGREWYQRSPAPRFLIGAGGFADSLPWLPHIPSRWKRMIRRMLNDDPAARCQSAGEALTLLAGVPIDPDWECFVEPNRVVWRRSRGDRVHEVRWLHDRSRYEWSAQSMPQGSGNRRRLGASSHPLTRSQSERELRAFFESQS